MSYAAVGVAASNGPQDQTPAPSSASPRWSSTTPGSSQGSRRFTTRGSWIQLTKRRSSGRWDERPCVNGRPSVRPRRLHRAWCRVFCRSSPYWAGVDGSRRHESRAKRLVIGTARESTGAEVMALGPHNPKVAGSNPAPATNEMLVRGPAECGASQRLKCFYRHFYRVEAGRSAHGSRRPAKMCAASCCMPGMTC